MHKDDAKNIKHFISNYPGRRIVIVTLPEWIGLPKRPPLRRGQDDFNYVGVIATPNNILRNEGVVLPYVNVDSTSASKQRVEIVDGVYSLVPGFHRYRTPKQYKAFYVMRYFYHVAKPYVNLDAAHNSEFRGGLKTRAGKDETFINFHRSNVQSDGSEGCITAPPEEFDAFRGMFDDLEPALLIKATYSNWLQEVQI